jgi:hypothetical protein
MSSTKLFIVYMFYCRNPRVDCHELPFIDLSYWRDTQYISDAYTAAKA